MSHTNHHAPGALPVLIVLAFASFSIPASAGLGGDAGSIRIDSVRLRGQLVSTSMLQYERHDITTSAGGKVHEYLSPSGKVFAVSWQARLPPDLQQVFGTYFEPFRTAVVAQSGPGTHRQVTVVQPDLVVQAVGRVRDFRGMAYVPSLVPAGVALSSLQ
jgi:hypothetical protein